MKRYYPQDTGVLLDEWLRNLCSPHWWRQRKAAILRRQAVGLFFSAESCPLAAHGAGYDAALCGECAKCRDAQALWDKAEALCPSISV